MPARDQPRGADGDGVAPRGARLGARISARVYAHAHLSRRFLTCALVARIRSAADPDRSIARVRVMH
jgi:hypothetical protein